MTILHGIWVRVDPTELANNTCKATGTPCKFCRPARWCPHTPMCPLMLRTLVFWWGWWGTFACCRCSFWLASAVFLFPSLHLYTSPRHQALHAFSRLQVMVASPVVSTDTQACRHESQAGARQRSCSWYHEQPGACSYMQHLSAITPPPGSSRGLILCLHSCFNPRHPSAEQTRRRQGWQSSDGTCAPHP